MLPIVTVIIPVYNAASTIPFCFNSILNQTYDRIEVVIIDDCSTDESPKILKSYTNKFLDRGYTYKVLSHEKNKGVASARNTGVANSMGAYIYYVDADDTVDSKGIDIMVKAALLDNADIVCCDWYLQFNKNSRRMYQPNVQNNIQAIEFFCKGVMRWNLWLFMVKRELYHDEIKFIDGNNMGEDMMIMLKLFHRASGKIVSVDYPVYYYGQSNELSLTKTYNEKHKREVTSNLEEVVSFYNLENKLIIDFNLLVHCLKLNIKLPLLITPDKSKYMEWLEWFKESNSYISYNDRISFRIKFLQFMALKRQFWAIRLHYYLVIKFVYGVLYK